MNTVEETWMGDEKSLESARADARELHNRGLHNSAHSVMLSQYMSIFARQSRGKKFLYTLLATWHAFILLRKKNALDYNQLDVLLSYLVKVREKVPFGEKADLSFFHMASMEFAMATRAQAKPHQRALAAMTVARVAYTVRYYDAARMAIRQALSLEIAIRAEPDQPQGFRQLVRILRKIGEICGLLDDTRGERAYYLRALILAKIAGAEDQVLKITALLNKIKE